MHQNDAVGGVHIKRLGLFFPLCLTSRCITDVAQAGGSQKATHIPGAIGLADLALRFVNVEARAIERGDTGRVLATVLKQAQSVINLLIDGAGGDDAHDATHDPAVLPFDIAYRR